MSVGSRNGAVGTRPKPTYRRHSTGGVGRCPKGTDISPGAPDAERESRPACGARIAEESPCIPGLDNNSGRPGRENPPKPP